MAEVGVTSEAELRRIGAVDAYRRLKFAYPRHTNLVALYALEGALTDTDWRALDPERVAALKREVGA